MASFNRIIIAGNLTRDPEYKQLPSGQGVCRLGLASNRQFKNRQTGTAIQEVCYVDIDVWGPQADSCNKFLQKGRGVLIEGRLKFDTWQDQQGQTRSKHSIVADRVVFLNAAGDQAGDVQDEPGASDSSSFGRSQASKGSFATTASSDSFASTSYGTQDTQEFSKIAQAVAEKKRKKDLGSQSSEFIDQPPFEDDLPF
ncbi:single-stranded DNA-binding protein [Candidatus Babeliales bacterium]|nr:single-stranded DNA-binding protein [Candidatus Babeliales bacterium]MBP9843841.1 single-stranded DNA-binding protein [Candidatus Babeliales bacterium]